MSTVGQHISNIRGLIEKYGRTSEEYTDQFLYELLKGARSEVLRNEIQKLNKISEWNWQTICTGLELSKPADCDCLPDTIGCQVLKTTNKIPEVFKSKVNSFIRLSTPGNKGINLIEPRFWEIYKLDNNRSKQLSASIINGYIYLWNYPSNKLKCIQISGVWRDPLELQNVTDSNTNQPCFSTLTSDFPIDLDFQNSIYKMVIELLKLPLQLQQDVTNDSSETIQA